MKNLIIAFIAILLVSACIQPESQEKKEFEEFLKKTETFSPAPEKVSNVINMLMMSGAEYNSSFANDTIFVQNYLQHPVIAAINCGSYSADALYHFAYNNTDAAFESYTAAQVLANSLGFGALYAGRFFERVREENEDVNNDSLFYEFDDMLLDVDSTLTKDDRHLIKLAYLAGNSIEKLYLIDRMLQSIEGNSGGKISLEANKLLHVFLNQEVALKNLIELIEKYSPEKETRIFNELVALYSLYYKLEDRLATEYTDYDTFKRSEQIVAISDQITIVRNLVILER